MKIRLLKHFRLVTILILVSFLAANSAKTQQNWTEITKLYPTPYLANTNEKFGSAVAISDDIIVVCASGVDDNSGHAYILTNDDNNDTLGILTASDRDYMDFFGVSVSIYENTIIVGATGKNLNQGCVYLFERPQSGWQSMHETAILTASDAYSNNYFGYAIDIFENQIVVGNNTSSIDRSAAYVFVKPDNGWLSTNETAKLTTKTKSKYFGSSVSVFGNNIIVGAPEDAELYNNYGAAYLYVKPASGWKDTTESAKLTPISRSNLEKFGSSVDIFDTTVVVGAKGSYGSSGNAVYVFDKPKTGWKDTTETAKLTVSKFEPSDLIGSSVSIFNEIIVTGAVGNDSYKGAAYIFKKPETGWEDTTETAKIIYSNASENDNFGKSLQVYQDKIIVGAESTDGNGFDSGLALIFNKPDNGWQNMAETKKIPPLQRLTNEDDNFGRAIAMNDNYIFVGSSSIYHKGQIYIFENKYPYDTVAVLSASDIENYDHFGTTIIVDKNVVVVGSLYKNSLGGAAYIFEKPESGWISMTETAKLLPSDGVFASDYFGTAISVSNDVIAIGARNDKHNDISSGSVYIFEKPENGWEDTEEIVKITPIDASNGGNFGISISIEDSILVVGADSDNSNESKTGAVYVFKKLSTSWQDIQQIAKLTASDAETYDYFGYSVSIDKNIIVIGAPGDDDYGNQSGSAYIFEKPEFGWQDMTETIKLVSSGLSISSRFGVKVNACDSLILVGADNIEKSSALFFFKNVESDWSNISDTTRLFIPGTGDDYYLYKNILLLSDPGDSDFSIGNGVVYIYTSENKIISINIDGNTLTANTIDASYQWLNCNDYSPINGATNQSYTPTESGYYAVRIEQNGLIDTSNCYSIITDVKLNKLENRIKVYPNPTSGKFSIELDKTYEKVEIEIKTITGQTIQKLMFFETNNINIDLIGKSGLYFLSVNTNKSEKTIKKIIKR